MDTKQRILLLCGLAALLFSLSAYSPHLSGFSHGVNDFSGRYFYFLSRNNPKLFPKIVTVAADDHSLRMLGGRWPWPRSVHARMVDTISGLGADTVIFDFVFAGVSGDPGEDAALAASISNSKTKVVLGYGIDSANAELIMPSQEISRGAFLGMLNSPLDQDEKTRRVRGFVSVGDQFHYSLSLQSAAVAGGKDPAALVSRIPLAADKTFPVNFLVKPGDRTITEVSFYDLLEKTAEIKRRLGDDFLKGAIVLVYPRAEILHDQLSTPVGKIPGAFLHLNAMLDIANNKVVRQDHVMPVVFCLIALSLLFFVFLKTGAGVSLTFALGLAVTGFWLQVILRLKGLAFDLSQPLLAILLFSAFFLSWKYLYFLAKLAAIKRKATLDPLKGMYTSRYFCYRLELERDNLQFSSNCHIFLVRLEGVGSAIKDLDFAGQKKVWEKLKEDCAFKKSYWAAFSQEELAGCVYIPASRVEAELEGLAVRIRRTLASMEIACTVRCGCAKFNREWQSRETVGALLEQLKKAQKEIVVFKPEAASSSVFVRQSRPDTGFIEGLDEDIEEKNRQLLAALANLNKEYTKTREVFFEVISSLVNALEARDPYTRGHSQRVANYAMVLAEKLGWSQEEVDKLRKAALLHDLGKIGIADQVLHKKGKLTDDEFEIIKQHEIIGVKILEPIREFNEILPWILHHHEKWNGGGYPHGLAGDAIPAASQIISLADVCDALLTGRDYKLALSFEDTIAELERCKGSAFNPRLTDVFVSILKEQRGKNNLLFKSDMLE